MKNFTLLFLFHIPFLLWAQKNTWSIHSDLGFNLSFNQMKTVAGNADFMHNKKTMSGYWSVGGKYQFSNKSLVSFGVDHSAYTYHYFYNHSNGAGVGSKASVFIWGFPIGLENIWLQNECIQFSTGYGFKYRLNRLGSPFSFESFKELYDHTGQLIFSQDIKEYDHQQQQHLMSLFAYAQFFFKIKEKLQLGFKLSYNQGLNTHESFRFEAVNRLPLAEVVLNDKYNYTSKASYLSFGISWSYLLLKKEAPNSSNEKQDEDVQINIFE
jgi:hypothetical protein